MIDLNKVHQRIGLMNTTVKSTPKAGQYLIFENAKELHLLCNKIFDKSGIKFFRANDKNDFLKSLSSQKFNAILVDVDSRESEVVTLISGLRKNPMGINQKTPMIVVGTALSGELLTQLKGLISGGLIKPFKDDDIKNLVNKFA